MFKNNNRLRELFAASPALMITTAFMCLDLLFCMGGLLLDHTIITGVPAWVKPAKFAVSSAIFAFSVALVVRHTPAWKTTLRISEFLIGIALIFEIVLIDWQAARHTTSHFNVSTPFDANVFQTMGIFIGILWIASIAITVATFRNRYASSSWTTAVRYGMLFSVLGSSTGGVMLSPSQAQLESLRTTHRMAVVGSHTIGGPDGGPGIPVLGWSTRHGDVRLAHFAGLHALQVFALLAFVLNRRKIPQQRSARLLSAAVFGYGTFFLLALWEALQRMPITFHGNSMIAVWLTWAVCTLCAFYLASRTSSNDRNETASRAQGAA